MKLFISQLHYKEKLTLFESIIFYILRFASFFYTIATWFRNILYDFNFLKSYMPQAFVVSVGNLTTGGVGKTPVVSEIANYYNGKGKKVAILSRGYGAQLDNKEPNVISYGNGSEFTSQEAGDEPFWLSENSLSSIVITCKSRVKAAKKAVEELGADVLVLDDGYQHRKIARNINCLLIDAANKFGNGFLLPAGPLRESFDEIERADKIIVVNKSLKDEDALKYCDYLSACFDKKVYLCKMMPEVVYNIKSSQILDKPSKIIAFSAIGQPNQFYNYLKKDYRLLAVADFEDHHSYTKSDIIRLLNIAKQEGVKAIVTTEKDAVKIKPLLEEIELNDVGIYSLKLKAVLDLEEILNG